MYRFFGWWFRWQACKMTARAIQGQTDEVMVPRVWDLAVFFETYMLEGAAGTSDDFGPKAPVELTAVSGAPN